MNKEIQNTKDNIDYKVDWVSKKFAYPERVVRLATSFSGIGAIEYALKRLGLKNKIVSFDFPIDTQYFKKDTPFAKEVKCESGDTLNTQGKEYFCNSIPIGKARTTDSNGNPVKQFIFNGVIPENYYFVMGDNPKSFDSRYWGFLEKENIRGVSIWKY